MSRAPSAMAAALAAFAVCAAGPGLRAQSPPSARAGDRVVSGVVMSGANGQPLQGAGLTLRDTTDFQSVAQTTSDAEGRFSFQSLADGRYELTASHRGFVTSAYEEHNGDSTAIVTGKGLVTTGLVLTLAPQAVIYGTVSEDSGDPVPHALVSLYRLNGRGGTGRMVRAGLANADEMGRYELGSLAPGTYYLCAAGTPWYATHRRSASVEQIGPPDQQPPSPLDVAYPTTCYPDVTDSAGAEPIPVQAGDRVPVNLMLHAVPAVHIFIHVPSLNARGGFVAPQLNQEVFGISTPANGTYNFIRDPNLANQDSPATVEIEGLAPGQYQVQLGDASRSGQSSRFASVDASAADVSLDASSMPAMAAVSGKVAMAGGGSLPASLSISLLPEQDIQSGVAPGGFAPVAPDGSFQIPGVRPGDYEVRLNAAGTTLAVTQLAATGAAAGGRILHVGSAPISIAALAAPANASVYGFAQRDGKPAPGVFVLLVPISPNAGREAWQPNQTDSDGSFLFLHVMPGAYRLVAIEQGWTLAWARPEVIGRYLARGAEVMVGLNSRKIDLKDPVVVQAK